MSGPLPWHRTGLHRRLTIEQAYRRATLLVDRCGLLPAVRDALHCEVGAPREFTARALLVGLAVHALRLEDMHLTKVLDTLTELPGHAQKALGLSGEATYRMVWHAFTRLIDALQAGTLATAHNHPWVNRTTGELSPCPKACPYEAITTTVFIARLLDASLPETMPLTGAVAVDSTDYETWARRRSWSGHPDVDPDHLPVPDGTPAAPTRKVRAVNEPGWPRAGRDGRDQHTHDHDARDGYRSGTNLSPGGVFCGHDLHLAVNARAVGGPEVPFVITGMHLAPAGAHKGTAGLTVLDQFPAGTGHRRPQLTEVLADRGYSFCTPARWAYQVRARGLEAVIDLHPRQRGTHPGPPGTKFIDGGLFSDALPPPLHDLPGFPIGMPSAAKAALRAQYDQRAQYAFTRHSRPDGDGYQRFKGPAVAGKVRCPNFPRSMRLPQTRPQTRCTPGADCACGQTLTLPPEAMAWTRQRNLCGTTLWAADYGRRSAVESSNAEIKTHRLHIDRGFTRVMGTVKNSVLLAFALAGLNVILLRAWYAKRTLPDPWATLTGEPQPATGGKAKRTRAKRRPTTLAGLIGDAPPG
ncbi:hypothetical protein G3I60_35205 [Streptomyces sp. SID13666]|uniref:hypothetical protein n=1 Tax=unclassified Streptomyces TaxID=2593676 RepID=UPI0013C082B7|nr:MULTISPECIES: hypothetical protein [unclassified Streptomyces]NEA59271.1 hypothetical protein [Streptomyces sp. SID13666]NEA74214.1 hypothetical protein [Streptomyces sp. SID13588]